MKQNIRYLIFITYWSTLLVCLMLIYFKSFWFALDLIQLMFLMTNDDRVYTVFIYPKLGKSIFHESGEYYLEYDNVNYNLYEKSWFYSKRILRINDFEVRSQETLVFMIKKELDILYKDILEKKNSLNKKNDFMNKWDGYTSTNLRRDDKLSKLIK